MIWTIENPLAAMDTLARQTTEIGLQAAAALAQAGCNAADRLVALQASAARMGLDNCRLATMGLFGAEPAAAVDPALAAVRQGTAVWRSLMGWTTVSQAEWAEALEAILSQLARISETQAGKDGAVAAENVPMTAIAMSASGLLATARAMCDQWARTARQFAVDSGVDRDLAASMSVVEQAAEPRIRPHRKAA